MSYTSYDFFLERIAPRMSELFKSFNPDDNDNEKMYDEFKNILAFGGGFGFLEKFQIDIINTVINADEPHTVEQAMQKFFNMFICDDEVLRKIEYSSDGAIIKVDYDGLCKELEKEERQL